MGFFQTLYYIVLCFTFLFSVLGLKSKSRVATTIFRLLFLSVFTELLSFYLVTQGIANIGLYNVNTMVESYIVLNYFKEPKPFSGCKIQFLIFLAVFYIIMLLLYLLDVDMFYHIKFLPQFFYTVAVLSLSGIFWRHVVLQGSKQYSVNRFNIYLSLVLSFYLVSNLLSWLFYSQNQYTSENIVMAEFFILSASTAGNMFLLLILFFISKSNKKSRIKLT